MPDGKLYHADCIHQYPEDFHVERLSGEGTEVVFSNGSSVEHTPCPHPPREITSESGYYSDWSVYAQSAHEEGIGRMYSEWVVPAKPKSRGPAPPLVESSVYLFNGLEDGGGHHGNLSGFAARYPTDVAVARQCNTHPSASRTIRQEWLLVESY
jgi:hypothetical protein